MAEQRLFISHASEDAAVADRILAYLEARGVLCWISSRDIPPRTIYADAIVEGMQACSACAVLVSAASNASKAVKREVELASHEDKPFVPIRIDGSEPTSGLAYYLRNSQWLDYGRQGEATLDRLLPRVKEAAPLVKPSPQEHVATTPDFRWSGRSTAAVAIGALLFAGGLGFVFAPIFRTVPEWSESYTFPMSEEAAMSSTEEAGIDEWARGPHADDITRVVVTANCPGRGTEMEHANAKLTAASAALELRFPHRVEVLRC